MLPARCIHGGLSAARSPAISRSSGQRPEHGCLAALLRIELVMGCCLVRTHGSDVLTLGEPNPRGAVISGLRVPRCPIAPACVLDRGGFVCCARLVLTAIPLAGNHEKLAGKHEKSVRFGVRLSLKGWFCVWTRHR